MWLLGTNGEWPQSGEIDILEGVNEYDRNAVTLHTTAGCQVDNSSMSTASGAMSGAQGAYDGWMSTSNCDVAATDQAKNVGCSIHAPAAQAGPDRYVPSYGKDFNAAGGGVYALEWTDQYIAAWFFPRNSSTDEFTNSVSEHPDPSTWGTPLAKFEGEGCDFKARFGGMRIIFDTSFCGDWAGSDAEWQMTCAKKTGVAKCADYVRDNPEAFKSVYWEIKGLRWFEQGSGQGNGTGNTNSTQKRDVAGLKARRINW